MRLRGKGMSRIRQQQVDGASPTRSRIVGRLLVDPSFNNIRQRRALLVSIPTPIRVRKVMYVKVQ